MKRTEHTQKWLDALRSGEYKQCRNTLRDGLGGYCCIGVSAKLLGIDNEDSMNTGYTEAMSASVMTGKEMWKLTGLNDNKGYTFPQIADEIEKMIDAG